MQHQKSFNTEECQGTIIYHNHDDVTLEGQIKSNIKGGRIFLRAANPIDRRSSSSGSGLPFANAQQAFENSPNIDEIEVSMNNTFSINILMPNSYYIGLGTVLVPPTLFIDFHNGAERRTISIEVNKPLPYKTLTYPMSTEHASRSSPLFYEGGSQLPSRSQEDILYDSAYPTSENGINNALPVNFWGAKPPC